MALLLATGAACAQGGRGVVAGGLGTSVSGTTNIAITNGTTVGTNLFHSFTFFDLQSGQTATFSGNPGTVNIVSRVTGGGAPSWIDGTLRSSIAGANVWFLNPSGVAFGPNASLDVSGSFHASSAHALKFASNGQFDMANPPAGTLTVSPTAFVFLSPPASITVTGSQLAVPAGKQISLVGGDISVDGGTLHAAAGQVNLASVRSAGEVSVGPGSLAATGVSSYGDIAITDSNVNTWSTAVSPGSTSGPVFIRGGKLTLSQSTVSTEHTGATVGGDIDVGLGEDLAMNGGLILATGTGTGAAGNITIGAANVSMSNASVIDTSGLDTNTFSGGQSGVTTINAAGDVSLTGGSQITSVTMTGTGGDIHVTARDLSVTGASSMINVVTVGSGTGGNIVIDAANVNLAGGGRISAGNETVGAIGPSVGNGGSITVNAVNSVAISGAGSGIFSSNPAFGNAGSISVTAGNAITLANGGEISTRAQFGSGGQITLYATDLVSLDHSRITTSVADGSGNGGAIFIDPVFVTLNASQIIADTFNGLGGQIDVITGNLIMDASSVIRAEAFGPFGVPGTVAVSAPNVDAGSGLAVMPSGYFDASALLRESCAVRGARVASSFVGTGRGALPAGPDASGYARYAMGPATLGEAPMRVAQRQQSVLLNCRG